MSNLNLKLQTWRWKNKTHEEFLSAKRIQLALLLSSSLSTDASSLSNRFICFAHHTWLWRAFPKRLHFIFFNSLDFEKLEVTACFSSGHDGHLTFDEGLIKKVEPVLATMILRDFRYTRTTTEPLIYFVDLLSLSDRSISREAYQTKYITIKMLLKAAAPAVVIKMFIWYG